MTPTSPGRSSLGLALLGVAFGALLIGAIELAVIDSSWVGPYLWVLYVYTFVAWLYIAAGLLAWWLRPINRTGPLIVAAGFVFLIGNLTNTGQPVLISASLPLATVNLAIIVHLLHAFPSGRLRGRYSKVTVAATYFVSVVLQAPLYLLVAFPGNMLTISDDPDLALFGNRVQSWAGVVVMVATSVILLRRLIAADARQRKILTPVYLFGTLTVLLIPLGSRVIVPWFDLSPVELLLIELAALAIIPISFAVGVVYGGFSRTGEIEELGAWLSHSTEARRRLTPVLARTLGDDSLEMLFWDRDRGAYFDPAGEPAWLPAAGSNRGFIEFDVEGYRVGAIVYDALLIGDPQPVRAAGRVAAISLAHEQLTAELRASEEQLRRSRVRIVEAGDRERRRIARNLHDGLQVRLVLLALDAQQVAKDPAAPAGTREAAGLLRAGIDEAAASLRTLVHEVMPAALIERGLSAATEDLVDRVPVRTTLDLSITDGSLSAAVESTAYFVVAEGITNALKHSGATEIEIQLVEKSGNLMVEIADDGSGGAKAGLGSGLRGLADRVDTLGGTLKLVSPLGEGTTLSAELPCAL